MSKAVRIRDHLYAELARRAGEERRSIVAQLELLLEQALGLRDGEDSGAAGADTPSADGRAQERALRVSAPEEHFKPDFK